MPSLACNRLEREYTGSGDSGYITYKMNYPPDVRTKSTHMKFSEVVINVRVKRFVPVSDEIVTAAEYLVVAESKNDNIKETRFIPPTIGERGFGKFKVTYRHPVLKEAG